MSLSSSANTREIVTGSLNTLEEGNNQITHSRLLEMERRSNRVKVFWERENNGDQAEYLQCSNEISSAGGFLSEQEGNSAPTLLLLHEVCEVL